VTRFFNLPNPSSCTMAIIELSTRILLRVKGRLVCKAEKLTANCESIV
jgi:hypothetical protein